MNTFYFATTTVILSTRKERDIFIQFTLLFFQSMGEFIVVHTKFFIKQSGEIMVKWYDKAYANAIIPSCSHFITYNKLAIKIHLPHPSKWK